MVGVSELEAQLAQVKTDFITQSVNLVAPVIEANNKRLGRLGAVLDKPVIGPLVTRYFRGKLQDEPHYWSMPWYDEAEKRSNALAEQIEAAKQLRLDQYGNELIWAELPGDYAGHYSPRLITRRDLLTEEGQARLRHSTVGGLPESERYVVDLLTTYELNLARLVSQKLPQKRYVPEMVARAA